ncbi:ribonuclease 1-like [Asparagus officinalis]|uniref:ribonuclease 1-like n=1 Tax=Asparagus officinalis TaxID=4686 RepID=UPI00098DEB73|nr:ribonuclease 1-like [Asparagus officinalis]
MALELFTLRLLSALCLLSVQTFAQDFDFFYFVQQWPGSYCDTQQSCCYPSSGKPAADFGIHGLWPNYNDGSYPSNCDPGVPFNPSKISDLVDSMQTNWPSLACPSSDGDTFWSHEWTKHGTCSESVLDERGYFSAALNLKKQVNLLEALRNSGIEPNDQSYSLNSISQAISDATGYTPGIECNRDESGNDQLYQVYVCVDTSGTSLIDCPVLPHGKCSSQIHFPSF